MSYGNLLQNLPPNERERIIPILDAAKKGSANSQQCKQTYAFLKLARKQLNNNIEKEIAIKLFAKAENLDRCAQDLLIHIEQNNVDWRNFKRTDDYPIVVKLFAKLRNNHQNLPCCSQKFFAALDRDQDFKKLLNNVINGLGLSDQQIAELFKAQYSQNYDTQSASQHRDALIKRIDGAGKLANLPKIAFDRLLNYIGKKLQLKDEAISLVSYIEKNNDSHVGEKANSLYSALKHKGDLQHFPQKTRKLLQARHNQANVGEMQKYLNSIKDVSFAPDIARELSYYEDLLIKIERGSTPSEVDLANLDKLHDTLKAKGKLDAMPNRSQAFLENYRTQREIKKKLPSNTNITELFKRLRNNQEFKPMEVAYFFFYLQKNDITLPPPEQAKFGNFLTKYSELKKITKQQTGLIDPKALQTLDQVIEQIRREEHRLSNQKIYIPELGVFLKQTSQFMEVRFSKETNAKFLQREVNTLKERAQKFQGENFNSANIKALLQNSKLKLHHGIDITARGANNGTLSYVASSKINPTIAEVLNVIPITGKDEAGKEIIKEHTITIFEFNPDMGLLISTYRHVKQKATNIKKGQPLSSGKPLGTYKIPNSTDKEHFHVERYHADKDSFNQFLQGENKKQYTTVADAVQTAHQNARNASLDDDVAKLVQPFLQGGDYQTIALLLPNTALNNQLLRLMKAKWLNRVSPLIANHSTNDLSVFFSPILRDQLVLETIIEMLLKVKLLFQQVEKLPIEFDNLLQKAQKTVIDLREIQKLKIVQR